MSRLKEWQGDYFGEAEEPLIIKRLRLKGFTDDQICDIMQVVTTTCCECYDRPFGCTCSHDE